MANADYEKLTQDAKILLWLLKDKALVLPKEMKLGNSALSLEIESWSAALELIGCDFVELLDLGERIELRTKLNYRFSNEESDAGNQSLSASG